MRQAAVRRGQRSGLRTGAADERGFAAAEAVVLALILCGICIVVGGILQRGALQAAKALNTELRGK
ncbi:MAG: hypothetical protein U1A78_35155 [Polyangia bacterium]